MKIKTLLLGSAAAFAVAGAAQAADLSVAEPVDYVRVCDAFGAGYWYIPGTDTCLKIGGYVRFDVNFHTANITSVDGTDYVTASHSAGWDFYTRAQVTVTAKSMTEYGPLTGYVVLRGESQNSQSNNNLIGGYASSGYATDTGLRTAYVDEVWLELGMLLVGRTGSIYDYSGGFTFDGSDYDSDDGADQVRLSWAMSGFGVQLAIEDPRDRWGTSLSSSYSMPNIVGAVTMSQGHWDGKLSLGFAETTYGSGFGGQIATTIKLDSIAPGDKLRLKAAFAQNEVWKFASSKGAAGDASGHVWSALASFQHFWTPTLSSAVTFDYYNTSGAAVTASNRSAYQIYGNLVWSPVTGFMAGVEGGYTKVSTSSSGAWTAKIRLERSW
jgi:hypothetical protein